MMIKIKLLLIFLLLWSPIFSQANWVSPKYGYSIEIPENFQIAKPVGANVDFKAVNGINSIVVVVQKLPSEYTNIPIWELLGDLETYGAEWEDGAREYLNNPKFVKYGQTTLNGLETFWYDYTTDSPGLYSKTYQTQKDGIIYTITLTCIVEDFNFYSPIWYRFKNNIEF
jgi:hypothetical protein